MTTANLINTEFIFHPHELAFCGYSGSGKTTLIRKLLTDLSQRYSIGFVKHDAHKFDMDVVGKDTHVARENGAQTVLINDSNHWAIISNGTPALEAIRLIYAPLDVVFVEGYKKSAIPKIILIDENKEILDAIDGGAISGISAYAGVYESYPSLNAPYFHRDDVKGISRHIIAFLGLTNTKT